MSRQVGEKVFITTQEVKDRLGWSRDTLYRFYRRGIVKPRKFLGDRKTYWEAEALDYLNSTAQDNTAPSTPARNGASTPVSSPGISVNGVSKGETSEAENPNSQKLRINRPQRTQVAVKEENPARIKGSKSPEIAPESEAKNELLININTLGLDSAEQEDFTDTMMAYWKRELPELDEEIFGLFGRLQRAGRVFDKDVERALSQHGLKVSEFLVLGALRRIGPPYCLTPTELFKSLLITSGTITKRIDRLEQRHLVERLPDPSDRRGTLVRLTPLGKEVADKAVAAPGDEQYRWLQAVLSPVERKVLVNLLRKLLVNRERLNE